MKKFSLVELLIVVAIIGLLVSLLLPSLGKARESAKTAVCISNVKQVNTALQLYTVDSSGLLPEDGTIRDTWPSFLDPLMGGADFDSPNGITRSKMSTIWGGCPNSKNTERNPVWFRDSDYAGVFSSSFSWPDSGASVSAPSQATIFTEGNHEAASENLGNSWIRVGNGVPDGEYNNITGFSWGRVRHDYQKRFVISNLDGSSRGIIWLNLTSFGHEHGDWLLGN